MGPQGGLELMDHQLPKIKKKNTVFIFHLKIQLNSSQTKKIVWPSNFLSFIFIYPNLVCLSK